MARMNASTNRFDPYRTFRFRVKWDNQYVAGLTKMGALKRTTEMVEYREAGVNITSLGEFRKNITLDVFNEAGQKALSYNLYRCWVSEYQALPDLDAGANAVAITTVKLEFEWFERDLAVVETQGPAPLG